MTSKYKVLLTEGAEQDLEAIYDYIAEFDCPANAAQVLDRLLATAKQLVVMPERGNYPRELLDLGIKDFRQVFFKPYRLNDCGWVSNRWAELLNLNAQQKQHLMTLDNPRLRLDLVQELLEEIGAFRAPT